MSLSSVPPYSPPEHTFSLKAAAAACGVDPKTIRRHLVQLSADGAYRNDDGVWIIPVSALEAHPRLVLQRVTPPDPPTPVEPLSVGDAHPAELELLRVRNEGLIEQLALAHSLIASERKRADDLAFVIHNQLLPAPPTPTEPVSVPAVPDAPEPKRGWWSRLMR